MRETPISKGPIATEKQCRITEAKRIGILRGGHEGKYQIHQRKKSIKMRTGKHVALSN